jgi:membrane fusion protein, multidrug efflux system
MVSRIVHRMILAVCLCLAASVNHSARAQDRPPAAVIVDEVLTRTTDRTLTIVGEVKPKRSSVVASETDGVVIKRLRDLGDYVESGEILLRLENDQLMASLSEARADVRLQTFNFEHASKLLETDAISEQNFEDSRYQKARARAKLSDLEDSVRELAIRAPFSGHVVQIMSEVGEWVTRGEGVVHLISIDTVRVHVNVPEGYVTALAAGDSAVISVDALGTKPVHGSVIAVLAEGFADSRTFPVLVEAPNPGHHMRSHMAARVELPARQSDSSLLIHKDALVTSPRGTIVYLVIDGKAVARPVDTGLAYQEYVSVSGDLKVGDVAIVRGNERLQDGQAVSIIRKLE